MPYVTSIERFGHERGKAEGQAEALLKLLNRRNASALPQEVQTAIRTTADLAKLESWYEGALDTSTLEEFRGRAGM